MALKTTNREAYRFLPIPTLNRLSPSLQGTRSHFPYTITGTTGSGKTTLVRDIIKRSRFARAIVFDHNAEYADLTETTRGIPQLSNAIASGVEKISYLPAPDGYMPDDIITILDAVAMRPHAGGLLLVVEEAHLSQDVHSLPQALKVLISTGRHNAITTLFVTQRPALLNRQATAQSKVVIAFQTTEYQDRKFLARLGFDEDELLTLEVGQCLIQTM